MRDVNIGKEVIIVYMMIKAVSVSFLRKIQEVREKSCLLPRISPSWVTALSWRWGLCNSVKLWAMQCRAIRDKWVIVKSSDKTWSTGGENGKPLQYSCRENSMNGMKRQKDMTLEDEPHRLEGIQYATGEEQKAITNSSKKNEVAGPQWEWHTAVDVSGAVSKVQWCKEQQCTGT